MRIHTITPLQNEATGTASPQLAAAAAFSANSHDVTLELADLSIGQLSAVAALMLSLDVAEARARSAEQKLIEHSRHCICHAAELAEAEERAGMSAFEAVAYEPDTFRAAA
jgi:hypothetical protein